MVLSDVRARLMRRVVAWERVTLIKPSRFGDYSWPALNNKARSQKGIFCPLSYSLSSSSLSASMLSEEFPDVQFQSEEQGKACSKILRKSKKEAQSHQGPGEGLFKAPPPA